MLRPLSLKILVAAALCSLLVACNRDSASGGFSGATDLLQHVPADSPYVFASLEPMPADVQEKFSPFVDQVMGLYGEVLNNALLEPKGEEPLNALELEQRRKIAAAANRLMTLFTTEGLEESGIGREARAVFYGNGLAPVLRFTLEDAEAFEATLQEIEQEAGGDMQQAVIDGVSYRYAGDDKIRVVVAIVDGQMVATIVPTTLGDDGLRGALGLIKPARSIMATTRLTDLADKYNFSAHGAGFVDFEAIVETFLSPQTGMNAALLAMGDYDADKLSDVCKTEIRSIAGIAPRLAMGYTGLTAERMDHNTVIELRSDIADGLATLTAPVPGLGQDHGGLGSFGMSIDLLAAREFYSARLDAMEAEPYRCELLADLQAGVGAGRQALQQPVPPMVYGVKGFLAVIDEIEGFDMQSKQPPTNIAMRFLLATDNAPGLMAMGAMFSPELASLNLQADGKPVKLELPQLAMAPVTEAWAAMSTDAIALVGGEGGDAKAAALLENDPGTPPPFMSMHMDAGRYYAFIGDAMAMQAAENEQQTSPALQASVQEMMTALADIFDRMSVNVLFTDRGIELPQTIHLAD